MTESIPSESTDDPRREGTRTGIGVRFACLAAGLSLVAGMATRAYGEGATGGVIARDGEYWIHTFTSNTAFVVSHGIVNVEWLIVGGGGAGGYGYWGGAGGGGGGGGITNNLGKPSGHMEPGTYAIEVGVGGTPGAGERTPGNNGQPSSAFGYTAIGGGGGGMNDAKGKDGGCGGGGGGQYNAASWPGGAGSPGGNGGKGYGADGGTTAAAGGGGFSAPGNDAVKAQAGHGGDGLDCSAYFGKNVGDAGWFAGGGGGAVWNQGGSKHAAGNGGRGGGGKGGSSQFTAHSSGSPNTGGGGGGTGGNAAPGAGTPGSGGSGIVIVRYVSFAVRNQPVTDVTATSATLNGLLMAPGGSPASVCVLWGEKNGGATWDWAKTDWFDGNKWTDNTPFRKKVTGLAKDKTYHYTFGAKNATGKTIAGTPISFITGAVTVRSAAQAWEKGPDGDPVPGKVTISRPAACTDAALTVAYAVSGIASNGVEYAKLGGTVTLPAGAASADIVIAPWNDMSVEGDETVIISLLPGPYVVGAAKVATVTIMDTVVRSFYVAPNATPTPPYDTWAKAFTNLQAALDHADAKGDAVIYLAGGQTLTGPALGAVHPDNTVFGWRGANNVMLLGGYQADAKLPPAGHPGPRDAGPTILRRSTADPVRVLTMSAVSNAVIEQVTIRDGMSGGRRGLGGGVFLSDCRNVAFRESAIIANTSAHSSVGLGGGMYLVNSEVTLTDTTIATNTVVGPDSFGGGLYVHRDSRLAVTRATIEGNRAITSDGHIAKGGGYYVVPGGVLELDETVVRRNQP